DTIGVEHPRWRSKVRGLPPVLDLVPISRRPTTLSKRTLDATLSPPGPDLGGDRLGHRRHDVSVAVVAPDGLAFTRLCLESLLSDHELDLEVVVVDNASTDGTREYLAALSERDSRVRVLRNHENRGFAPAVNQAFAT